MLAFRIGVLTSLALAAAGCGGSSPASPSPVGPVSPPAQTTGVTFVGSFQTNNDQVGSVTLAATLPATALPAATFGQAAGRAGALFAFVSQLVSVPVFAQASGVAATGSLSFVGGNTHPLTGTYDAAAGRFALSGQSFTVNATVGGDDIATGTITHPGLQGALVAMKPTPAVPVTNFRGSYTGDSQGKLTITRSGSTLRAWATGHPVPIIGTVNGSSVNLSFDYSPPDVGRTTVIGTLSGSTMSGTWRGEWVEVGVGPVVHTGTWSATAF